MKTVVQRFGPATLRIASIQVLAKPKYSNVETALEDAALQIADWVRENK